VERTITYDAWGTVRHTTGTVATRLGYTGEWMGLVDGTVYLRARHYQPTLGRFLQRDSFPGIPSSPQSLHKYTYAHNNALLYTDPSGMCIGWIWNSPRCQRLPDGEINIEDGLAYWKGVLETEWEIVKSPFVMVHSLVTSGEYRATVKRGWDRLWDENWLDLGEELFIELVIRPIQDVKYAFVCDDAAGQAKALTSVFLSIAGSKYAKDKFRRPRPDGPGPAESPPPRPIKPKPNVCSFTPDTLVSTADGLTPIGELAVGELVWAYNEATGTTDLYTITAVLAHADTVLVDLTIDGEPITTTPEHPFFTRERSWVAADALRLGDHIRAADGTWGVVERLLLRSDTQVMYNLTVATAHTFFVGEGGWLVHNTCWGVDTLLDSDDMLRSIWGDTADEIGDKFRDAGYDVDVQPDTKKGTSGLSTIVTISKGTAEKTHVIQRILVHPGDGTHKGAYYKISTSSEGLIKIVDPATYVPDGEKQVKRIINK